jgi:non-specific protein-tyrosine kinase
VGIRANLLVLRERWKVLLVAVALGGAGAAGLWFASPRQYQAHVQLYASYVSPQSGVSANDAYSVLLMSQQRVTSYVELVTSDRVAGEVVNRLGLRESPADLASQITATNPPQTVLIDVTVEGTSPTQVAAIANTVAMVVHDVAGELDAPSAPTGTGEITMQTVERAAVPTSPSSIGLPTALVLGVLAGAVVGVGAVFLRNAMDTSVRTAAQLWEVTDRPVLGTISWDPDAPRRPLTSSEDGWSPRAEEFLRLRTNLDRLDPETGSRVVLVTSAVPGEGKSTTVCNLAAAIARSGRRVVVVDADLRRSGLTHLLGLRSDTGLTGVLTRQAPLGQALQTCERGAFDVLPSGPPSPQPTDLLSSEAMRQLLAGLRADYAVVLIDSPALLPVADGAALAPATDGVLLVCRYHQTSESEVRAAVEALHAVSANLIGTVLTLAPRQGPWTYRRSASVAQPADEGTAETQPAPTWTVSARVAGRHAVLGGEGPHVT